MNKELLNQALETIGEKCPDVKITEDCSMSRYTSFRAGGKAACLIEVCENEESGADFRQLRTVLDVMSGSGICHMLLGNGSNTLFKDTGYDGVVIKLGEQGYGQVSVCEKDAETSEITAGPAALMAAVAKTAASESLTGFEPMSGIPGSIGGAVFMNAGAYGGEMKDIVKTVTAVSSDGKDLRVFSGEEMDFGYRHSILEENGYIAVSVTLEMKKGNQEEILAAMNDYKEKRNTKQPVQYPSAGSTFKRPEGYFAGKLIQDAGLKGLTVGGAQVSTLHSGFVINYDNATATDILQLMALVQNTVYDKFGVMLEPEVRIIG